MKRYILMILCIVSHIHGMEQAVEYWASESQFSHHFEKFIGKIDSYAIEPLAGGLVSAVPCMCTVNGHRYVIRTFRGSFENRQTQIAINRLVADCGISPYVYHYGNHDDFSFIIMDFIDVPTLSFEQGIQRVTMNSAANKLRSIAQFDTTLKTNNKENYFEEGMRHYRNIKQRNFANFDPILEEVKDKMEVVAQKLESYNRPLLMGHNDFHPRNMFFAHDEMIIIDWDFIGINYEYADLAAYSVYFCLSEEDDLYLLTEYLQHTPSVDDIHYFKTVKVMARLLYVVSFFELIQSIPEVETIKDFKYYATLFAQDATHDSSEFFYECGMSQLQEACLEYELLKNT